MLPMTTGYDVDNRSTGAPGVRKDMGVGAQGLKVWGNKPGEVSDM